MSEVMDDYDAGFKAGQHDLNRIIALKEDLAFEKGYDAGKKFAQDKVLELMNEVIESYEELSVNDVDPEWNHGSINAVKFMKSWVCSGGQTDEDGNRVCLPW